MAHDVFISYSSKDKPIADGVCANLEGAGVRCWIAPRDIAPGEDWPTAITRAISQSRVMVLVFSAYSNSSEDVSRELFLAANSKLVIIPFKIENIEPEPGKQYYLARTHWLDAINPPTQEQIRALIDCVKALIPVSKPPPIVEVQPATPSRVEHPVPARETPKPQPTPRKKAAWARFLWIPGILLVFLCLAVLYVLTFITHTIALPTAPTARATATAKILATPTPTPDLTAKVGLSGVDLYNGPSDNYPKIDFTYNDLRIIGQAYGCAWLKVSVETGTGVELGWVNSNQVIYSVKCSDIPADASTDGTRTAPTIRLTPTLKCQLSDTIFINNQTNYEAILDLIGPEDFNFKLPLGITTVHVCSGSYDYTFIGACGSGGANTIYGRTFGGDKLNFICK